MLAPGRAASGAARFYLVLGAASLALAALSLLIPSTPSYDPWAWLVWGREIVHLNLHTTGGPTWKPLPVIFTTAFAPLGHAAPDLWLLVARTGALMAAAMCFRVAWRLTHGLTRGDAAARAGSARIARLVAPALAGLIAVGTLLNAQGVISQDALGYSEGLMVALVLIALERHYDGAHRQAFVIGFFAALDRPELWLLWIPYGVQLWRTQPGSRKLVLGLFALVPALWFLPELWGSGHLLRGVVRAQTPRSNSAAFAKCPFCTEFAHHAWRSALMQVKLGALVAMAVAALTAWARRPLARSAGAAGSHNGGSPSGTWDARARARRVLLVLGTIGFAWWIGVALETQAGFSGNDRYLVLGTALIAIVGGAGWAWAAHELARRAGRIVAARARGPSFRGPLVPTIGAAGVVIGLFIACPPWIGRRVVSIPATHGALIYQAHLRHDMAAAVAELGGPARILGCGTVMTEGFQVPMLAWMLGVHTLRVQAPPFSTARPGPPPNVIFQTRATRRAFLLPVVSGWKSTHYRLVAHVRTFNAYSSCAGRVTL